MKHIFQIIIKETTGLAISTAPVQFGIPLPRGGFFSHKELDLICENNTVLLSDITVTTLWPDNSIKWCLIKSQVTLGANEEIKLYVTKRSHKLDSVQCIPTCLSKTDSEIKIKTKNCEFRFNKNKFNFIDQISKNGRGLSKKGFFSLNIKEYGTPEARITAYQYQTTPSAECPLSAQITFKGEFRSDNKVLIANFEAKLTFFMATDTVKCSITLHNPKAAKHYSGVWDLGDPNSLFINSLNLGFNLTDMTDLTFRPDQKSPWTKLETNDLTIYQESSGGDHWNSPNHKDRHNKIPFKLNGFECRSQNSVIQSGKRASPTIRIKTRPSNITLYIEDFWQNFPKLLQISNGQMTIGLFPDQFKEEFELQPGERKTHTFYLNFNDDQNALECFEHPPQITLNPLWIEQTNVFPYFDIDTSNDALLKIIKEGVTSKNNFFAKREAVDEYGWRNFGDLYADHETDGYTGKDIFVSHYNNQYDPIYGFLRQYILNGDHTWLELADDLASHVTDIDIYHTHFDKEEYNGGLFWHTDHYLDAATSSHRSYSKYQQSDAYMDHAGGGGPGGQHCYTTGLLYHYLLTGKNSSRLAVIQLADWITHVYEGSGTIFDVFLSIKNHNRIDLKNCLTGKYPLDRGTGNYINALLDKFELTQEHTALKQVEHIIKNTVHPLDDLESRDLNNAEINWYYTVFFQAACRYLQTKEELSRLDTTFYYVRDTLLHYADWMSDNEYPYLKKPEILEFPNHTWTAQDIRKVNVLLMAAYYSPKSEPGYLQKAEEIYQYILDTLSTESTRTYTRILAILMQNHGAMTFFEHKKEKPDFKSVGDHNPPKLPSLAGSLWNISLALLTAIRHFSLKKEIAWLACRSDIINRLFKYQP